MQNQSNTKNNTNTCGLV